MRANSFCIQCHENAPSKNVTDGYFLLEVALWAFFIVPGILYSLWRLTTRHKACRACGSANLVPSHSDRAKAEIARVEYWRRDQAD